MAPDGSGKAPVNRPRLYSPRLSKRGVVRLWPDEEVTLGLCVAEGSRPRWPRLRVSAWHGQRLSAGNLAALPVLPGMDSLTVIVDHDKAGIKAADECHCRWLAPVVEGRRWMAQAEGDDSTDSVAQPNDTGQRRAELDAGPNVHVQAEWDIASPSVHSPAGLRDAAANTTAIDNEAARREHHGPDLWRLGKRQVVPRHRHRVPRGSQPAVARQSRSRWRGRLFRWRGSSKHRQARARLVEAP